MKILELTNYSAGICGVFQRVKQESLELSKNGHEILILSSNAIKGSDKTAPSEETIKDVKIKRFPFKKLGGESFMFWDFEKSALEFSPDIIIAHSYRHPHTTKALKLAKKLNTKVFLVTHAPFNRQRGLINNLIVKTYDILIGKRTLRKFNKIITITNWEVPYLQKLGVKKDKIVYIPNGIPREFFTTKKIQKEENKLLFLGRISPIKNLKTPINALKQIPKIEFEIVGPKEQDYYQELIKLIKKLNLEKRITFSEPIYKISEKIKKLDSCKIFILPSLSEGMPQSLIEAMARGKIVIASNNQGNADLIQDGKNGLLFETHNTQQLISKVTKAINQNNESIKIQAKKSVEKFNWDKLIKKLEDLF